MVPDADIFAGSAQRPGCRASPRRARVKPPKVNVIVIVPVRIEGGPIGEDSAENLPGRVARASFTRPELARNIRRTTGTKNSI